MGFKWRNVVSIVGVVAAPFTGGASLALTGIAENQKSQKKGFAFGRQQNQIGLDAQAKAIAAAEKLQREKIAAEKVAAKIAAERKAANDKLLVEQKLEQSQRDMALAANLAGGSKNLNAVSQSGIPSALLLGGVGVALFFFFRSR